MATEYHHGSRTDESSAAPLSVTTISTAVIGMVCTASDADAAAFPLNQAVLITQPKTALAKAGVAGTLAKSLSAIADQVTCPVIVVRVEEGADEAATSAKIIGGVDASGAYTGMQALLTAEAKLGVRPRILGVPGHDLLEVTTALVIVAQKLRAFVYASCGASESVANALLYRKGFAARELTLIWPDFTYFDSAKAAAAKAMTIAIALGLRAQIDQDIGFHKTLSNVPVNGVTGIDRDVYFALQQTGTDADLLNAQGITTLIGREGFRFWGSRTCDSATYIFESYTRTAQVLADSMAEALFPYIDQPASAILIREVIDGFNRKIRQMVRAGQLLGGKAWFDPSLNSTDDMKNGRFAISYEYTPVPPFEQVTNKQSFTDTYFATLSAAVSVG
ncbi:phage tail sheath protein FI [Luteibacter sp. 1214]|uniref:phage tail sheath subtilisin-like domain-containing protein n=1 Tax=Luteibacter sp. 1214 TaxID=2817735 RepID=UPI0028661BD5|nr:phage tail sheath subtilisin-like domain-containing protein [Luteibacter sp. 1214]MDR6642774.1 phage tail sheath protein FI [Luteibacter sp. 1214]